MVSMNSAFKLTAFDKFCGVSSIVVGLVFMIMGVSGLFGEVEASFVLPQVLGFLLFFLGWGMSIPLIKFWRKSNTSDN